MTARVLEPTSANLALAAQALREGELVAMPTETVYGLAAGVFLPAALARVFAVKERPTFDPLIVHVSPQANSLEALAQLELIDLPAITPSHRKAVKRLIEALWPGPLTLVLPKNPRVPELATSGLPSVGIRMPAHPVAARLIEETGFPLAAPSANRFGRISPTSAAAVAEELGSRIPWILDGGRSEIGLESTVVGLSPDGSLTLYRPGGVGSARLEEISGLRVTGPSSVAASMPANSAQAAPGMLTSHYAPGKPLILLPAPLAELNRTQLAALLPALTPEDKIGLLLLSGDPDQGCQRLLSLLPGSGSPEVHVSSLSRTGNLLEAAHNLFAELRALDQSPTTVLLAEPCTLTEGIGHAIGDRLRRASAKRPI